MLKKTWYSRFEGLFMYRIVQKCKLLKTKAKEWNKTRFRNIFRQINKVDEKLIEVLNQLVIDQDNTHLHNLQERILIKMHKLFQFQEKFWFQRAKTIHFAKGDSNSKYFHACGYY